MEADSKSENASVHGFLTFPPYQIGHLSVRAATTSDPPCLGRRLRYADRQEIYAAAGLDGVTALENGLRDSRSAYAIEGKNAALLAMFGVVPDPDTSDFGLVWLLGANDLTAYGTSLLKLSRTWVGELGRGYGRIGNYVDERNVVHVRWIRSCGFEFVGRVAEHGFEGRPFLRFERRC